MFIGIRVDDRRVADRINFNHICISVLQLIINQLRMTICHINKFHPETPSSLTLLHNVII